MSFDLSKSDNRKRVGPQLARRMMAILAVRRDWTTRAQFKAHGLNDRMCRLGRECSHGRIMRGQRGYKLLRFATPEEVRESAGAWIKQIQAEQREYSTFVRRAHKVLAERGAA